MAVKRRYIECECGENFAEGKNGTLEGKTEYGAWKYKNARLRQTKTGVGGDIVVILFNRNVRCTKCGRELLHEKKNYELTPADMPTDKEPSYSSISRELLLSEAA